MYLDPEATRTARFWFEHPDSGGVAFGATCELLGLDEQTILRRVAVLLDRRREIMARLNRGDLSHKKAVAMLAVLLDSPTK